jgi:hypothetical protein
MMPFRKPGTLLRCDQAIASFLNWRDRADEDCQAFVRQRQQIKLQAEKNQRKGQPGDSQSSDMNFAPPVPPSAKTQATVAAPKEEQISKRQAEANRAMEMGRQSRRKLQAHVSNYYCFADDEMEQDVATAEEIMGARPAKARELARRTRSQISASLEYPEKPQPKAGLGDDYLSSVARRLIREATLK